MQSAEAVSTRKNTCRIRKRHSITKIRLFIFENYNHFTLFVELNANYSIYIAFFIKINYLSILNIKKTIIHTDFYKFVTLIK